MCCAAAFATGEPGVPDKLSEQFQVPTLLNLAEMVLVVTVIPAPARFVITLSHVGTSSLIALEYNPALLYLIIKRE